MKKPRARHQVTPKRRLSAFTLIEVLIVTSIILILVAIALGPSLIKYMARARDSKRKQDLNKLVRIMEDYYNDNQHYPPAGQTKIGTIDDKDWGTSFSPYLSSLPKDPASPGQTYYYQAGVPDLGENFFVLYAKLEDTDDPNIIQTGCEGGCGPDREYNYVVHSTNIVMLAGLPNGEVPPGGGDGGGGGGEPLPPSGPSSTPGPTSPPGPTATDSPTPTVTPPSGAECGHEECCAGKWCGGGPGVGIQCGNFTKCYFDAYFGYWDCVCSSRCGAFWCGP